MDENTPTLRPLGSAMLRGLRGKCPACGRASLFSAYLKVNDTCHGCREDLSGHEADDAPAYFTILIVGHLLVPIAIIVERHWAPSIGLTLGFWTLAIIGACLITLPRIKGALIAFQWARFMHGYQQQVDPAE